VSASLIIDTPERREIALERDSVIIGRDASCDVVVDHHFASRKHARIWRVEERYRLEDLGSRNGTWLNGERLGAPKHDSVPGRLLSDGDEINVAGVMAMKFHDPEATHSAASTPVPTGRGLRLDDERREVWVGARKMKPPLPPAQYVLLRLLVERAGKVCTRDDIVATVWPKSHGGVSDEAVDGLVKRLRARLKELAPDHSFIEVIRGHGLKLVLPEPQR